LRKLESTLSRLQRASAPRSKPSQKRFGETAADLGFSRLSPYVTREDDCAEVVEAAVKRFGPLDILVNNAGRGMKYVSNEFLTEPTRFWEVVDR